MGIESGRRSSLRRHHLTSTQGSAECPRFPATRPRPSMVPAETGKPVGTSSRRYSPATTSPSHVNTGGLRVPSETSEQENLPTSYPYAMDVGSRWFLDSSVDLRCRVFGRQLRQAAGPKHQSGNDGSGYEDQGGPQEGRRVAVEQSCPEIGRGRCPTDQIGRGSTRGQRVEQRGADGSPHLLRRVEGGRSHTGVLGCQPEGAGAEGGGNAQPEPDTQHEEIGQHMADVRRMQPDQVESEQSRS